MKGLKDINVSGAKSMVMMPIFASKTQVDRKKKSQLIRKEKYKNKNFE